MFAELHTKDGPVAGLARAEAVFTGNDNIYKFTWDRLPCTLLKGTELHVKVFISRHGGASIGIREFKAGDSPLRFDIKAGTVIDGTISIVIPEIKE